MNKFIVIISLVCLWGCSNNQTQNLALYQCPMNCISPVDQPGECPKCHMDLVLTHHKKRTTYDALLYHCPMHPTYTSARPGECPICGMNLVPVDTGEELASEVQGQAALKVSQRRRQMIGLKTGFVKKRPFVLAIRTVGRVAYDPDLYHAQEDYLGALTAYNKVKQGNVPESTKRAKSLVESSKLKLRLLGLSNRQIQDLAKRQGPDQSLLISGGVSKTVWLYADAYESDLPLLKIGQDIEATTISYPGEVFTGRIKSIDPVINPKTRSARVRAEIVNREGMLKPDMYLNAVIKIDQGEKLAVPEEAVIVTGPKRLVFVDEGEGYLSPREVLLGAKTDDYYHVKSGLSDGEKIVVSGNFLIDSESKLKAALSAIAGRHQH